MRALCCSLSKTTSWCTLTHRQLRTQEPRACAMPTSGTRRAPGTRSKSGSSGAGPRTSNGAGADSRSFTNTRSPTCHRSGGLAPASPRTGPPPPHRLLRREPRRRGGSPPSQGLVTGRLGGEQDPHRGGHFGSRLAGGRQDRHPRPLRPVRASRLAVESVSRDRHLESRSSCPTCCSVVECGLSTVG